MNSVWWGQETIERTLPGDANPPLLLAGGRVSVRQYLESHRTGFSPEWSNAREGDAGYALLKLHAELAEPIVQRLNRLPERALIEFLRTASVMPSLQSPARAMLAFSVSDAAPRSVLVVQGFQVSASAADGSGSTVIFETERSLYATPGKIESSFVQEGARAFPVDLSGSDANHVVPVFGANPRAESALLLGLNLAIEPQPSVSFGVQLSAKSGAPPPVSSGGSEPVAGLPQPLLRWEFFDGSRFEPAEVIGDQTRGLQQSGVVELRAPRRWRAGTPSGVDADKPLRWLRLRVVFGEYSQPPQAAFFRLNLVGAIAARTVRNEVLEYVPGSDGRRLRLSQTPVLSGSLQLTVDDGAIDAASLGVAGGAPAVRRTTWQEVDNLNAYGPDDRVYQLDAAAGELQFGNGLHGAILPRGFRHVIAERYQVATGKAGAVAAEQITSLVSSAPFLTGVSNPLPASGGRDEESLVQTLLRGPQQIRARGRAVTAADYGLLALRATGADIRRAHAVAGIHAGLGGAKAPGVVSVFLLGPPRSDGPPYPDSGSLDAVSRHLAKNVAPAGVEVVAAAPQFHRIGVRAKLVIATRADAASVIRDCLVEIDIYFDPIEGGDQGQGWPFGGIVHHNALVRRLLSRVENLLSVSALNLNVDGQILLECADFVPRPHHLLWPDIHELQVAAEAAS